MVLPVLRPGSVPALALGLLLIGCHGGGSNSAPKPDFGLAVTPAALSIPAGGSGYVTVTATRQNGFGDAITVSLAGAPAGVSAGGTLAAGASSLQVVVLVGAGVAPQTLAGLTFSAQSGGISHAIPFQLVVAAPLPLGALSPDRVQAAGGRQTAAGLENHVVVGEPNTAASAQDTSGTLQVRHGFRPAGSPQLP